MKKDAPRGAVWVVPNRNTVGLVAVLLAMFYAGASQGNGAAYLLCFVLTAVSAVSIVHAWANLRDVVVRADSIAPVFVGTTATVPLTAAAERGASIVIVEIDSDESVEESAFPALGEAPERAVLRFTPRRRGRYEALPMRVMSQYPLGFFTARRQVVVAQAYYVYPAPTGDVPLPHSTGVAQRQSDGRRSEGDDFSGVRSWLPGESQRHIDWKAAARGQPLLTKQWTGDAGDTLFLEWQALAPLETEARLSQLARWVVTAERGGMTYGLHLPGAAIKPGRGESHYHACLRALAGFAKGEEEIA